MAPNGRNRRAGELLGAGTPAEEIPALIGQASEALDTVPLIAEAIAAAGSPAEALDGLAALIEGEIDADDGSPGCAGSSAARGGGVSARVPERGLGLPGERATKNVEPASLDPGREGGARPRLRGALPDHLRDVYSYAYYRVGNHHDAEDLTEQAFLQAYRHFERARRGVRRAAAAAVADPDRPQPRAQLLPRPLAPAADAARRADPIAAQHGTEAIAEGREELRQVMEELDDLPDDRRDALIMRFALGMDNREIARALGRTDGATKVLIHRAIKQLQEEMGDE